MYKEAGTATEFIRIESTIELERGASIENPVIALERLGQRNDETAPVVLIFTGISPDAHVASSETDASSGWWEYMVGSGKAINTDKFHVICVNTFGSCRGSSSPCSINEKTGKPYAADFPEITLWDGVNITALALEQIGINKIFTVIGPSMGGMSALAWLITQPGKTRHMINISAAVESGPFAIALRSLQRQAIISDPDFDEGNYNVDAMPLSGMIMARKMGLISYRSAYEWRNRFGRSRDNVDESNQEFVIESYLDMNAEKFATEFDPLSYIRLSQAMDWFSINEREEDAETLLQASGLQSALIIGVDSDILFPEYQQREMSEILHKVKVDVQYECIASHYGHDAFLLDEDNFSPLVHDYLSSII